MLPRETINELNALSKEVFGASSRWQKILKRGETVVLTEEVTEYVPGETDEDEGITRQVQVPIRYRSGDVLQYVTKYHDADSIRELMLKRKVQLDKVKEEIKKAQEELDAKQKQEELQKNVHSSASGFAK